MAERIWILSLGNYKKKLQPERIKLKKNSYVKPKSSWIKLRRMIEEDEDYEDEYMFPIEIRLDEIKDEKK